MYILHCVSYHFKSNNLQKIHIIRKNIWKNRVTSYHLKSTKMKTFLVQYYWKFRINRCKCVVNLLVYLAGAFLFLYVCFSFGGGFSKNLWKCLQWVKNSDLWFSVAPSGLNIMKNFSSRQTLLTPVAGLKSAALVTTDQSMLYWTFWSFKLQM